jgi:CheY-like chemotaxis protein
MVKDEGRARALLGLPGLTGYQVATRMRGFPGCEGLPIIAISGYAREVDRAHALQTGFSDHLAKPIDVEKLEELVARAQVPSMGGPHDRLETLD